MLASAAAAVVTVVAGTLWYQDVQYRQELSEARRAADATTRDKRAAESARPTAWSAFARRQRAICCSLRKKIARGDWSDGRLVLSNVMTKVREETAIGGPERSGGAAAARGRERRWPTASKEAAARRDYQRFVRCSKKPSSARRVWAGWVWPMITGRLDPSVARRRWPSFPARRRFCLSF